MLKQFQKTIYLTITIFVTLCIILCSCNQKNSNNELAQYIESYNENCSYKFNGSLLIAKGDEILLNEGYGTANYIEGLQNTPDSVYAIGSITKSFTAVSIMQLQEKGLLSVNDPISKYIDGHERGDDITIRQLLTHTSGISREGKFANSKYISLNENLEFINKCTLINEPGTVHEYSNAGYIMLAAIIEKVSDKSYNDYIQDNIFTPLNMTDSICGTDCSYAKNQSIGYRITTRKPMKLSLYNFSCITGCGNIYSTTNDLYKYYIGLTTNSLLSKESTDIIFSSQWGNENYGYGYGWFIGQRYNHTKIFHGGCIGGGGYNSSMIYYPDENYVMIFLTNNSDTTALDAVSQSMEAILFNQDYVMPEDLTRVKVNADILKQYAGDYNFSSDVILSVKFTDGKLYSTADDGNYYELIPLSKTEFYYEDHECTRAEFIIDNENQKITLKINSKTYSIKAIKVD